MPRRPDDERSRPTGDQEVVLSGMRPTAATLHLGNYFGALYNFIKLQEQGDKRCYYFVANWHAFTTLPEPREVHDNVLHVVADYVAAGLDPERSVIYAQSSVPETAEIALLLSNCISHGRLVNSTTFKEKASKQEMVTAGLAFYPVLMAADILGVKARWVPVGADQMQHLEMAREIARFFNKRFGPIFPEPENFVTNALRVPGLDGTPKMGKSEGNTIGLDQAPDEIWKRLSVAMTDPARKRRTDPGNPMLCNVYGIAEIMNQAGFETSLSLDELAERCRTAAHGCLDCKRVVFEAIRDLVEPIRKRKSELMSDPGCLVEILLRGGRTARERIAGTLDQMREALGTGF